MEMGPTFCIPISFFFIKGSIVFLLLLMEVFDIIIYKDILFVHLINWAVTVNPNFVKSFAVNRAFTAANQVILEKLRGTFKFIT